jgi:hypothetical protein
MGETPSRKNTAGIFAQNRTIAGKGQLILYGENGANVALDARPPPPHYFFVFHLYKQSSGDSGVALEAEHAATLHRHDPTVTRARTS